MSDFYTKPFGEMTLTEFEDAFVEKHKDLSVDGNDERLMLWRILCEIRGLRQPLQGIRDDMRGRHNYPGDRF